MVISKSPNYLFKVVPSSNAIYNTRNTNDIPLMNIKHNFFKNTLFPSTIIEWNKLHLAIRNSASPNSFQESILKFIRPAPNSIFSAQSYGNKTPHTTTVNFSYILGYKSNTHFKTPLIHIALVA